MPAAVEAIRKKIKAGNPGMKESSTFAIANVVRKRQLGIPIRKHVTEEKLANLNKVGGALVRIALSQGKKFFKKTPPAPIKDKIPEKLVEKTSAFNRGFWDEMLKIAMSAGTFSRAVEAGGFKRIFEPVAGKVINKAKDIARAAGSYTKGPELLKDPSTMKHLMRKSVPETGSELERRMASGGNVQDALRAKRTARLGMPE